MTRGERVCEFIERYLKVPEGDLVGQPFRLLPFQRDFILAVYDNPAGTRRAYLSIGRKNGKTALLAAMLLAHICGPEARQNSQIISGALSRKQAAIVFDLACKMIRQSAELSGRVRIVPSSKKIVGLGRNVEYEALSAEAGTAHGLSPILAIIDEAGQIKGDHSAFIEAIETAQGAYSDALFIVISTQAATDGDLLSKWLDEPDNPEIVKHVYAASAEANVDDWDEIKKANPALGVSPRIEYMQAQMERALSSPAFEPSFRWLHMNQRVTADAPFVARSVWEACAGSPEIPEGSPVWLGLDLSAVQDLTALVMVAQIDGVWHAESTFWLPDDGLDEKSKSDRVPYTRWRDDGFLVASPGKTVDLEFVAARLLDVFERYDVRKLAFDRWGWSRLEPELIRSGLPDWRLEEVKHEFGQGYKDMSPALMGLESDLLNRRVWHGNNPILNMCAANATVAQDPAGNRKLVKPKERHRRIDGMIALAMAHSVATGDADEIGGTGSGELFFA